MKKTELWVEDYLYEFYRKVGAQAGKTAEQVMADALFRFAGEASLPPIYQQEEARVTPALFSYPGGVSLLLLSAENAILIKSISMFSGGRSVAHE